MLVAGEFADVESTNNEDGRMVLSTGASAEKTGSVETGPEAGQRGPP